MVMSHENDRRNCTDMAKPGMTSSSDTSRQSSRNADTKFGLYAPLKNTFDFFHRAKRKMLEGAPPITDSQCVHDLVRLCIAADQLGLASIWIPEQHGNAVAMGSSPLTILLKLASLTRNVELGAVLGASIIDAPLRVAEQLALTDVLLGDRRLEVAVFSDILAHETLDQARDRIDASAIREAVSVVEQLMCQEWVSFSGTHFTLTQTSVRPRPSTLFEPGFVRLWGDGLGEESRSRVATGIGRLNGKPEVASADALVVPVFCSLQEDQVARAKNWWVQEFDSELWHAGIFSHPATREIPRTATPHEITTAINRKFSEIENDVIAGTPIQCVARIDELIEATGCQEILLHAHFGLMPVEQAEKSLKLLMREFG